MNSRETANYSEILRLLPSIDALLQTETAQKLVPEIGAKAAADLARAAAAVLRVEVQKKLAENGKAFEHILREDFLIIAEQKIRAIYENALNKHLQKVINATGVIIHTNLGRAPLS